LVKGREIIAITAFVWLAGVITLAGQAARPPMAEEVFKNVQVLTGIPVDQFMGTMGFLSASLGLNCTDCHTEESGGSWARYADDNNLKRTARRMMLMVAAINKENFGGRQVVTCDTCHRGSQRPNVMPSLDRLYGEAPPEEPGDPFRQATGQPPPEQILDKYLQALGGADRVARLTSFTAKGTYSGFDDAGKSPVEMYAKAPDQRTTIVRNRLGDTTTTIDGRAAWMAAPLTDRPVAVMPLTGQELDGLRLETEVLFPARIKQALTNWRTGFPAVVDEREVLVVQGDTAGGGVATLVFDEETGLLTRLVRYAWSPVGRLVTRVDYADYREVAGVKMPFRWTVSWLSGRSRFEITDLQPNVAIDSGRFARPAPSAPARP
jgi:outer membrane lipoprotein-sorting protein